MLSICIVNWNTKDFLRECLASIEEFPPRGDSYEIIVVDNASSDGSAEMVKSEFPKARLIASETNLNFAGGCNVAMNSSKGEQILLLNPDTRVEKSTFTNALVFLENTPDAGAIGIRQVSPDGKTQQSVRGFPTPQSLAWEILGLSRLFPKSVRFGAYRASWIDYDHPALVDQPMATFLMIRREVYSEIGGMDESFPLFFNDVDLCKRILDSGWKIYYTPDAKIWHYGGGGTALLPPPKLILESHSSMVRFYNKHYRKTTSAPMFLLAEAAITIGGALRALASLLRPKRN
jgi:GT2 family glycosyltransferase